MMDLSDRKYVKRLPDAYAKGEESTNNKLLRLNDLAVSEVYECIDEVVNALELDNAEGVILDDYGEMFGVYRAKLTDKQYRAVIKATIAANISKGDYASVMSGLSYIFSRPKGELSVYEVENQICTVKLSDMPYSALMETGLSAQQVKDILKKLLAVAIKVEESQFEGTFEFGSIPAEYDESKGFGDISQTIGGYLGTIISGTTAVRTRMPQIKFTPNVSLAITGNPIAVNGETVQAGSGEPSPTNVRQISTGLKYYREFVFTGSNTETEKYTVFTIEATNITCFYIDIQEIVHPIIEDSYYEKVSPLMCSHIKTVAPKDTREGLVEGISFESCDPNNTNVTKFRMYLPSFNNDLEAFKSWVKSLYEAGTPLTVWAETREPTGDYYACHSITDSNGNYRAYGEKMIGGAMYSGDTYDLKTGVETHTKAKIVLDGTQVGTIPSGGKCLNIPLDDRNPEYLPSVVPQNEECAKYIVSDYLPSISCIPSSTGVGTWNGQQGISLEIHSPCIQIHIDGLTTLEEYNAYLAANPLTVVYELGTPITYQHEPFYEATVSMKSATNGASMYYTTNGDTPTNSSAKYSREFTVNADTQVKAIARSYGLDPSKIADKTFIIP